MIFNITYYLKLYNVISIYCTSRIYQQILNWLFEHYRTLTTLLDKKLQKLVKRHNIV
jgi:hypothetical protein